MWWSNSWFCYLAVAILEHLSLGEAAIISSPFSDSQIVLDSTSDIYADHSRDSNTHSKGSIQLPLETNFTHDLAYFTNISIGTPPQVFRVLVDIGTPDTSVSSINCTNDCAAGDNRYDASTSSTSVFEGRGAIINNLIFYSVGPVWSDTFRFGSGIGGGGGGPLLSPVQNQSFLAADLALTVGSSFDDMRQIHGFLGLAPTAEGSDIKSPSILMNLVDQGVLTNNLMTIRLQKPQILTLGAVNESLYRGDIKYVPLTHGPNKLGRAGTWQTSAKYMTLETKQHGITHFDLDGLTAQFYMLSAFICVPYDAARTFISLLEFQHMDFMPPVVPCDRRPTMPNLTFNLAGKNFTLTPWEYTLEWPLEDGLYWCASAIMGCAQEPGQEKEIMLGSAFLRKFYSIWDVDHARIGFAELS